MNALRLAKTALGNALESVHEKEQIIPMEEMVVLRKKLLSAREATLGSLQEEIRARIITLSGSEWSSAMQRYNMVLEANLNPSI